MKPLICFSIDSRFQMPPRRVRFSAPVIHCGPGEITGALKRTLRIRMFRLAMGAMLVLNSLACAHHFTPSTQGKKLIKYGQDFPNPAYCQAHVEEMEKLPFDGVVIGVTKSATPNLGGRHDDVPGDRIFGHEKINAADYEHAIDELRATKFKKFTDNFLLIESMPGNIDWYDDADFDNVLHNISVMARIAKLGGCVGIEFDPEEYGNEDVWSPHSWKPQRTHGHSEEEFIAKARERGQQFMHAINAQFPGIQMFFLFGPTLTYQHQLYGQKQYLLLAPFIEGMCEAADKGTTIADAYEQSYGYRTMLAFKSGRETVLSARAIFKDKAAYDRVMRVGFGLWLDNNSGKRGWHPDEPMRNVFQPNTWQIAINGALSYSDKYVWLWNERLNWWTNEHMSQAYIDATRAGKTAPGHFDVKHVVPTTDQSQFIAEASQMEGHDEAETFGDVLKTRDVLLNVPNDGWFIRMDPDNVGLKEKWFSRWVDANAWEPIEVDKFWEEQGWDYDGVGWYRTMIHIDQLPKGKKLSLVFGAADEDAQVWLNGKKLGAHERGEIGWDELFEFDVTNKLHVGDNQLTVRVFDRTGPGGIWKSVKILSSR